MKWIDWKNKGHIIRKTNSAEIYILRYTIRERSNGTLKLQIAASTAFSAATNIVFKFKKLI